MSRSYSGKEGRERTFQAEKITHVWTLRNKMALYVDKHYKQPLMLEGKIVKYKDL